MHVDKSKLLAKIIITLILLYLVAPVLATVIYSFSTSWVKTILPEGLTFQWYLQILSNQDFVTATLRSLGLAIATTLVSMVIFLPVIFYVNVYSPKMRKRLRVITVLPYTIPGIILVTGLMELYQNVPIPKVIVLILAITFISLPLSYQTLDNTFVAHDYKSMFEQAMLLGDGPVKSFLKVIIPNIKSSVFISMLLTFATAFGEYVITNLLLGGNFETLKIYMYILMQGNGQASSVLTTIYFLFLVVISVFLIYIMRHYSHHQGNKVLKKGLWFKWMINFYKCKI